MKRTKNVNANTYRVLHEDVGYIKSCYKWACWWTEPEKDQSFKDYLTEYAGVAPTFIDPIFNRNGFYQNRKTGLTWFEIDGLAFYYESSKSSFDYQLEKLNEKVHSSREITAMKELVKLNSLSPKTMQEIRQALYNHANQYQSRMMDLDGLRVSKRATQRIFEFKEKNNIS